MKAPAATAPKFKPMDMNKHRHPRLAEIDKGQPAVKPQSGPSAAYVRSWGGRDGR